MRNLIRLSALLALFVAAPAMAQGTSIQREACEGDARTLCDAYIPDAVAIEKCLRASAGRISAGCRAELSMASPSGGKRRR
jgi:hypothetical protein